MPVILFLSFVLAIGLYIVQPLSDPDLWWHIVSGRWVIANQSVPSRDIWTQFGGEIPWVAYSWSNEIIFAFFERWFGLEGLLFLQMTLAVAFTLSLCWSLGNIAKNHVLGALLGGVIVAGCHAHYSLRPQSLAWILLTLTLLLSEKISERGWTRSTALSLAVVFCVWANSHITTVVGLAALAVWILPKIPWKFSSLKTPILACLLALLATFVTPYFGYEWIVFFTKSGHPMMFSSIQEFAPATILQVPTAFLLILSALVAAFWFLAPTALRTFQVVGAFGLILGSLAVVKFLPFALIYLGFLLAKQWQNISLLPHSGPGLVDALQKLEAFILKVPKEGLSFVLLCVAFLNAHNTWQILIDQDSVPAEAVDFIKKHSLATPILNTFGHGGYLSYRYADAAGNPGIKVAIDGRTNLINHDVWESYQKAWAGKWGWQEYLDKVKPETILWRGDSALIRILEAQGKWCTVFRKGDKRSPSVVMLPKQTVDRSAQDGGALRCLENLS